MQVQLRNPTRTVHVPGPSTVTALLSRLEINPESVLVIRNDELVTRATKLVETDRIEIRPVISGGAE